MLLFFPSLLGLIWFRVFGCIIFFAFYAVLVLYSCRVSYTAEELSKMIDSKALSRQQPAAADYISTRIQRLIQDEFYLNPEINMAEFSDTLGVNNKYVSDYIHYTYGETFLAFVNHLRVEHAAKLLAGSKSVIDVAEQSGFVSESTFYRNFIKFKGVTPSQYRENLK